MRESFRAASLGFSIAEPDGGAVTLARSPAKLPSTRSWLGRQRHWRRRRGPSGWLGVASRLAQSELRYVARAVGAAAPIGGEQARFRCVRHHWKAMASLLATALSEMLRRPDWQTQTRITSRPRAVACTAKPKPEPSYSLVSSPSIRQLSGYCRLGTCARQATRQKITPRQPRLASDAFPSIVGHGRWFRRIAQTTERAPT
jgi:hypothetical protein